jgi:hypothetical protein
VAIDANIARNADQYITREETICYLVMGGESEAGSDVLVFHALTHRVVLSATVPEDRHRLSLCAIGKVCPRS